MFEDYIQTIRQNRTSSTHSDNGGTYSQTILEIIVLDQELQLGGELARLIGYTLFGEFFNRMKLLDFSSLTDEKLEEIFNYSQQIISQQLDGLKIKKTKRMILSKVCKLVRIICVALTIRGVSPTFTNCPTNIDLKQLKDFFFFYSIEEEGFYKEGMDLETIFPCYQIVGKIAGRGIVSLREMEKQKETGFWGGICTCFWCT